MYRGVRAFRHGGLCEDQAERERDRQSINEESEAMRYIFVFLVFVVFGISFVSSSKGDYARTHKPYKKSSRSSIVCCIDIICTAVTK
jgi:hypothetical protein